MDIVGILRELKDTPLPTIFVIAGVIFLLLAVGVQIRGQSTATQQKVAGAIGAVMLLVGLGLFFIPPIRTPQPATQPTATTQSSPDRNTPLVTAPTNIPPSSSPPASVRGATVPAIDESATAPPTLHPTSTPKPTIEPTQLPPPPVSSCPTSPDVGAAHLGAGKRFQVAMRKDCYYHFNLACAGCQRGQEDNIIVFYNGDGGDVVQVTVPEGSVWEYGRAPDANEVDCGGTDRFPKDLPDFLKIPGVKQVFPCP